MPCKTAEYKRLMDRLRREQEEREYASIISAPEKADSSLHSAMRETSSQVSAIFNILFSTIFTGLAVWFATSRSATYAHRLPLRVGLSMSIGLLVAVAEVVLYAS